jgi:hypothetical protein
MDVFREQGDWRMHARSQYIPLDRVQGLRLPMEFNPSCRRIDTRVTGLRGQLAGGVGGLVIAIVALVGLLVIFLLMTVRYIKKPATMAG